MITTDRRIEHKLGKDYGIVPIHLEHKYSIKQLEDIYQRINDILYYFSYLYVGKDAREYLLTKIEECGNDLNNLNMPLAKVKRKEELLDKLRDMYLNVKKIPSYDSSNFFTLENKMAAFQVSKYLKEKKQGLTDEQKIKWLKNNKMFSLVYTPSESLKSVQDELLADYKID